MSKHLFILFIFSVFTGCKSTSLFQEEQNTTEKIVIGNVGLNKDFLLEKDYKNIAIPEYKKPIKVAGVLLSFNKKKFNAFHSAKEKQFAKVTIHFADTLVKIPKYLNLKILDKITVLEALKDESNREVKEYLAIEHEASLVTQISIAFDNDVLSVIEQADKMFLIQNGMKSYGIQLFKKGKKLKIISLSEGVVFSYKTQSCCWKANNRLRVDIVDLVDNKVECPNKTYSSANRAEKKINYYKL